MSQSTPTNSYIGQQHPSRQPRGQKRATYVLDESSPDVLSLPAAPPQKKARKVATARENNVDSGPWDAIRAGAGRKKRSAPESYNDDPTGENAPSPSARIPPTAPPKKKVCTALGERDNNVDSGRWGGLRPRAGRRDRSAVDARSINTTREYVVNTTGETVVLRRLPSRLPQALHHNSHLNGHTVLQVVPSQRDPAPASTFEEVPEEIAPEPAPEYTARTLRQHAR